MFPFVEMFAVNGITIIVLTVITFIVLSITIESKTELSLVLLLAYVIFLLAFTNFIPYISQIDWKGLYYTILIVAIGHFGIGVVWAIFKTMRFFAGCKFWYDKAKDSLIADGKHQLVDGKPSNYDIAVWVRQNGPNKYIDSSLSLILGPDQIKGRITRWMLLWEMSVVEYVIADIIRDIGNWLYAQIQNLLNDIAKKYLSEYQNNSK